MVEDLLLTIGIITAAGFVGGLIVHWLRFPLVTGYIVIGIILSPSMLDVISSQAIHELELVTVIGLAIIAYTIGADLEISEIRKMQKSIAWITPVQSLGTWLLVTLAVMFSAPLILDIEGATLAGTYFPLAFLLGAIAAATAPATTLAIVHEYEAKGPMTTVLLSMVGLDDAITIVIFSVALGISIPLVTGSGGFSLYRMLGLPLIKITAALGIGAAFGFLLLGVVRLARIRALALPAVFGTVVLCTGLADKLGLSHILAGMTIGFIVGNLAGYKKTVEIMDDVEDIIFVLFFVLAGLHFELNAMETAGFLALILFAARLVSKYFGSMLGAAVAGSPPEMRRYIGLGMLPAAGVSIGLALLAKQTLPSIGDLVLSSVLAFVIVAELISPPLVKYAIEKAGETGRKR